VSQERTEGREESRLLEAEEKREQRPDTERELETEEGNPT
jgi:hypothetical protein